MKKYLSHIFIPLILFIFSACQEKYAEDNKGLTISGKLENGASMPIYIWELTPSELIPLDTIITDANGNFVYSTEATDAGFYRLGAGSPSDFITLAAEPNEHITLTANAANLRESYNVEDSPGSYLLWQLNRKTLLAEEKTDSLRKEYRESRYEPNFAQLRSELKKEYRSVKKELKNFTINLIETNPGSLASILVLYHHFEDNLMLDITDHFQYFNTLSESLCRNYSSNKHVINLKKRVNDFKRNEQQRMQNESTLAPGMPAPEISLPNPQGNYIRLSSFKGSITLVNFWAAWCPPCREANHVLGNLYEQYNELGFEIYGVSLDRTREQWLTAIETDEVTWTQVSDLRFMNSPVVSLYNINEVPHYVLLDREGNIISRNFSIQELENKLERYFSSTAFAY